jgi:hypothetical protein
VAARLDIRLADTAAVASCDHDGKANGRLVLERDALRREIVCDCGQLLAVLGRQEYHAGGHVGHLRGARDRWRRSRALLSSVGGRRRNPRQRSSAPRLMRRS